MTSERSNLENGNYDFNQVSQRTQSYTLRSNIAYCPKETYRLTARRVSRTFLGPRIPSHTANIFLNKIHQSLLDCAALVENRRHDVMALLYSTGQTPGEGSVHWLKGDLETVGPPTAGYLWVFQQSVTSTPTSSRNDSPKSKEKGVVLANLLYLYHTCSPDGWRFPSIFLGYLGGITRVRTRS